MKGNIYKAKKLCYYINVQKKELNDMIVSYNKLFKLLIDKNMKKTELAKATGIGQNTLAKLSKNQNVSMDVLARICEVLNCNIGDIVDFVEGEN